MYVCKCICHVIFKKFVRPLDLFLFNVCMDLIFKQQVEKKEKTSTFEFLPCVTLKNRTVQHSCDGWKQQNRNSFRLQNPRNHKDTRWSEKPASRSGGTMLSSLASASLMMTSCFVFCLTQSVTPNQS